MTRYLSDATLDALRQIGDPDADALFRPDAMGVALLDQQGYSDRVRDEGFSKLSDRAELLSAVAGAPVVTNTLTFKQEAPDDDLLDALNVASMVFQRYGNEIAAALLLAALPEAFAAEGGAHVLVKTRNLATADALPRRIRGTAQFLMLVMARDTELLEEEKRWAPIDGRCWRTVVALRLYHASIREHVRAIIETAVAAGAKAPMAGDAIINQEDLLGMLLGFSIGTLDVLERFGIRLSDDEKEAYLVAWNHIGSLLGIGSVTVTSSLKGKAKPTKPTKPPTPLVPANCPDARRLSAQIRTRVWPDISALTLEQQLDSTDDGRQLIVAMLEDLRRSMPKFGKKLPQLVMRQLVDPRVRDRLALGEGGLLELGYGQFLELIKASPIGRTFDPGTLSGPALRSAANLVTRNSVISFLGEGKPPFVIPGLEEWIDAVGSSRRP